MKPFKKMKDIAGGMQTSIVDSIIKQKLASKLGFKIMHSFTFVANRLTDEIIISGWGLKPGAIIPEEVKGEPMKLSESEEIQNIAMGKISSYIPVHIIAKIDVLSATYDFDDKSIAGVCKFENLEGRKQKQLFNSKFK